MRELNYKLIISDFDGTLGRDDKSVSYEDKRAIDEYIEAGGIFAVSTGRMPFGIMPTVKKLGLRGVISCCQGAMVLDIESGEVIFEDRLSMDTALGACRKMEEMGVSILAFDMWKYYSNRDDELVREYERNDGVDSIHITDKKLSQFLLDEGIRPYKLIAVVPAADNAKTVEELSAAGLESCVIVKSLDTLVEAINDKYSKGSSVRFLAEHYGISIEKTVGIGDNCNDIPMIEAVGLGAAVKNSEPELKAVSDYVCVATNNESAVAEVIEKFGFCR